MTLKSLKIGILFACVLSALALGQQDSSIPSPESILGHAVGEQPARAHHLIDYFTQLDQASPRTRLIKLGHSYEGRPLVVLAVSSEANIQQLDAIRDDLARLADPRQTSEREAKPLFGRLPAVAWMMYNVHGNELSGADAALRLAHELATGEDETAQAIRQALVVFIDPCQNPDGRERTLSQIQQWTGRANNPDGQSMEHGSVWPGGRSNHYLCDLNRDWFIGSQTESKAKVRAMAQWNPQLVVDAHEMGSYATYFFNPPREPISHHIHGKIKDWWQVFAQDQAAAFDRRGWSYYTNESFDEWYPGYGSSWAFGLGSVAILYEQASSTGSSILRPEGKTLDFAEAVEHQFVSSMANLTTAATNRKKLLEDFYTMRVEAVKPKPGKPAAYVLLEGSNPTRTAALAENLINQGVEVQRLKTPAEVKGARSYWSDDPVAMTLPAGSYVIAMDQPLSPLATGVLEFDVRMSQRLLAHERKSLETGKGTRMYEVGAWSMPLAYGVEALALLSPANLDGVPYTGTPPAKTTPPAGPAPYGYLLPYQDDASVHALIAAFGMDLKIRCAAKPFTLNGRNYGQGTLLVRRHENGPDLDAQIASLTQSTSATFQPVATALTEKGINLGSGEFRLLQAPRIAIVGGSGISTTGFGALWHLLDTGLGLRASRLDVSRLGGIDLRPYNVLVLPSSNRYKRLLGPQGLAKLADWVSAGGTLIALEDAAAALTDSTTKLSQVRLRRDALAKLAQYQGELAWEAKAGQNVPDSLVVWENTPRPQTRAQAKADKADPKALAARDKRDRLYRPRGVFLRVDLDPEHWLGFGVGSRLATLVDSDKAYLSKRPVETAARFAQEKQLRLSGLLWPEARIRWAQSAYLTRERRDNGQVILFAGDPIFRGYTFGTGRLLINAMLLGPGMGTHPPRPW